MHATESPALAPATRLRRPVVIGHRGAPAYRPEHTIASFELAIDLGADLLEPDVVVSRDGALVVRHDRELSLSTDVSRRPEFADRRTVKTVRGVPVADWFVEDFDLAELRTLRSVEPMPELRPLNTAYDGRWGILTLAEVIEVALERRVGVIAELAPRLIGPGRELAVLLAAELRRLGLAGPGAPVVLQSFEPATLHRLRVELGDAGTSLVQLIDDHPSYDDMLTPGGLREVSTYAQAIGPSRHRILLRDHRGALAGPSDLVDRAHVAGLDVHVWKLMPENAFLPRDFWRGTDPVAHGDAVEEARMLLELGVDGLITDAPETAVRARSLATVLV